MARTQRVAQHHASKGPRKQLASKCARKSAPSAGGATIRMLSRLPYQRRPLSLTAHYAATIEERFELGKEALTEQVQKALDAFNAVVESLPPKQAARASEITRMLEEVLVKTEDVDVDSDSDATGSESDSESESEMKVEEEEETVTTNNEAAKSPVESGDALTETSGERVNAEQNHPGESGDRDSLAITHYNQAT